MTSALRLNGLSDDLPSRITQVASSLGVPFATGTSTSMTNASLDALGRFDWMHTRIGPLALTVGAGVASTDQGLTPLQNMTQATSTARRSAALQVSSNRQTPGGWLTDWHIGGSWLGRDDQPMSEGPGIVVRLPSDSGSELLGGLGGAGSSRMKSQRGTLEAAWQGERMVGLPLGGTHQLKLFAQQQSDVLHRGQSASSGTFSFPSIDALAANVPDSYRRVLHGASSQAVIVNLAFGAGDVWRPNRFLMVQAGVRADLGAVLGRTDLDTALLRLLPFRSTSGHSSLQPLVSPRLGFVWTYRKEKAETPFLASSMYGNVAYPGHGVLRGGVGLFRSYWNVDEILEVRSVQGGARSLVLTCGTAEVPGFSWFTSTRNAPTTCAGGAGSSFTQATGTVLSPSATPPAAWRANLTVSHALTKRISVDITGLVSYGFAQRAPIDRNLSTRAGFTMASEGERPSYWTPADLDPATGSPLGRLVRPVSTWGPVVELSPNGRNRAQQLTVALQSETWHSWMVRGQSTLTHAERLSTEFQATGIASLSTLRWAPSVLIPRVRTAVEFARIGRRLIFSGTVQHDAGATYTPIVSGDINGDGLSANDRAFVSDELVDASRLGDFPAAARACLMRQRRQIAEIGSCTAPWSLRADVSLTLLPDPMALARRGGGRATYTVRISNVAGLLDQLVHRTPVGWGGGSGTVDPVVESVRGFDPITRSFLYATNRNFGRSTLGATSRQAPYLISIDAQIFLGASMADQQAVRTLRRSQAAGRSGNAVNELVARLRRTFADPYQSVLEAGDSLLLQRDQVEAIEREQRQLSQQVDSVWRVAAAKLTAAAPRLSEREGGEVVQRAYTDVIRALQIGVRPLRTILSAAQVARLPSDPAALLAGREPLYYLR